MSTKSISNFTQSWTQSKIYAGIGMNVVDTAGQAQSKLINLRVNSTPKFTVDKQGKMFVTTISSSYISASSMTASKLHVGRPPQTSQYTFSDGTKPDLYTNKLRAYSASFTNVEIISGSQASFTVRNSKGEIVFATTSSKDGHSSLVTVGRQVAFWQASGSKENKDAFSEAIFPFKKDKSYVVISGSDVVQIGGSKFDKYVTASFTGSFAINGEGHFIGLYGNGDVSGSINFNYVSGGINYGFGIEDTKINIVRIQSSGNNNKISSSFDLRYTENGSTKIEGTHSIILNKGRVKIDSSNDTIKVDKDFGKIIFDLGIGILRSGTQSLYITGSTISASHLNIFAPDTGSSANIFYVTASKGNFNQLTSSKILLNTITASNKITASSAGASTGKYAKIKIGNQTYKILLYADS